MNQPAITVFDIFAGPGGLGEGFASFTASGARPFRIELSVEMDRWAHHTLRLRSFYRQFVITDREVPEDYYRYLRGEILRLELFAAYPAEAKAARRETRRLTLGRTKDDRAVDMRIDRILARCGKGPRVLIGGPPCQAYSVVGRSRLSALRRTNLEKFEEDPRHVLYKEYLRILARVKPDVFVMENVKGILSSRLKGKSIFQQIVKDLACPSRAVSGEAETGSAHEDAAEYDIYPLAPTSDGFAALFEPVQNVTEYVVRAEAYGVPQARHRVFLLGIRRTRGCPLRIDLDTGAREVSVEEALSGIPELRSRLTRQKDSWKDWQRVMLSARNRAWFDKADEKVREQIANTLKAIKDRDEPLSVGGRFVPCDTKGADALPSELRQWLVDSRLGGQCNHTARAHMKQDLYRYLFAACYAEAHGVSPVLAQFPETLHPAHLNVEDALNGDMFADRFRVQVKKRPGSTVTAHLAKDGHYAIHPDPGQCRSLSVREAARLQTFPDNYFFEGARTEQYRQVGNAVPPFLASKIAALVYDILGPQAMQTETVPDAAPIPVSERLQVQRA